jgi:hypothetical protein
MRTLDQIYWDCNHKRFKSNAFKFLSCQIFAGEICVGVVGEWVVEYEPQKDDSTMPPPEEFKGIELLNVRLYSDVTLPIIQLRPIEFITKETRDFPGLDAELYWYSFNPFVNWGDSEQLGIPQFELPNVMPGHEIQLLFSHFTHYIRPKDTDDND